MKWTESEFKLAIDLLLSGNTYEEISYFLKRTIKSIKCKLNNNGYLFDNYHISTKSETSCCLECEKEFISLKSTNRKFCSNSCSASFNNKINKIKHGIYTKDRKTIKYCIICNQEITKNVKVKSKYCSHKCEQESKKCKKIESILSGKVKNIKTLKNYITTRDEKKCKICGIVEWNNKEINLVLDHIDGDSSNNFPANLRLLCPNCDAQTETFTGKNRGKGRKERRDRYKKRKINNGV